MKKDIRHMRRNELLRLLLDVQKENEALRKENEALHASIDQQRIDAAELGSIAEVAMRLNHVFEDAQRAADAYVSNAKAMYAPKEETSDGDDE